MLETSKLWKRFADYRNELRDRRAYHRTVAAIADLPPHLLKDIGWPGPFEHGPARRGK